MLCGAEAGTWSTPSRERADCVCKANLMQEHQYPLQRQATTASVCWGRNWGNSLASAMSLPPDVHRAGGRHPVLEQLRPAHSLCQGRGLTQLNMVLRSYSLHSFMKKRCQAIVLCLYLWDWKPAGWRNVPGLGSPRPPDTGPAAFENQMQFTLLSPPAGSGGKIRASGINWRFYY